MMMNMMMIMMMIDYSYGFPMLLHKACYCTHHILSCIISINILVYRNAGLSH